jgi:proteic killer suppression protein
MILSFRDDDTERLWNGETPRRLRAIEKQAKRKLDMVYAATLLGDLRSPPGNKLEALSGDRRGQYSIRINDQWRVCFIWTDAGADKVEVTDHYR